MIDRNVYFVVVVTLKCDRKCPLCMQQTVMEKDPDYDMSLDEFNHIVSSCKERGLKFNAIELTGGEPTMWPHFEEGLRILHGADISGFNMFVTNGDNAEFASNVAQKYSPFYGVSYSSGATQEMVDIHKKKNPEVFTVDHKHKKCPTKSIPGSRPAVCCIHTSRKGEAVVPLTYYKGRVYHCHNAVRLGGESLSVSFESDFVNFFSTSPRDQEICSRCLCNNRIWNMVE